MNKKYDIDYKYYTEQYPELSNTDLARFINRKHPEISIENARTGVRYYRGVRGKAARKKIIGRHDKISDGYFKRFSLPIPEDRVSYEPFKLEGVKRILVMADIHIPDHDNKAIKKAMEFGKSNNVDCVVLLGDLLDGYMVSKFSKDPTKPRVKEELDICKQFLAYSRQEFPKAKIVFKCGNHDARVQHFLMRQAPEISDLEALKLDNLLNLRELDIEFVPDMQVIKAGKINLMHGHELKGCPSVNIARNIFMKAQQNILFGHFHRCEEYIDIQRIGREIKGSYSVGCLSNTQPDYNPYSQYVQGFAVVELDAAGNFKVKNKKIIAGEVV